MNIPLLSARMVYSQIFSIHAASRAYTDYSGAISYILFKGKIEPVKYELLLCIRLEMKQPISLEIEKGVSRPCVDQCSLGIGTLIHANRMRGLSDEYGPIMIALHFRVIDDVVRHHWRQGIQSFLVLLLPLSAILRGDDRVASQTDRLDVHA
jgi:hypothetical protein